ncbi:MAG: DUF6090 family protein [Salegentibacter sp.]
MLGFLRHLRKKLLQKNKFSSYFLYATGEVFLIVIGILIALAINNWNQNRLARNQERFYLEGLKTEFEQSRYKLQQLIEVNRLNYQESIKIAGFVGKEQAKPKEQEFSRLLYNSFSYEIAYNPNNSLLNELINSGSLKNISNPELRKHLTSWDSWISGVHQQEQNLREQREKILDIFRGNTGSIRTILDHSGISTKKMGLENPGNFGSNLEVLELKEFENNLLLFILTAMATESSHYEPLLEETNSILGLLEAEIDK